MPDEDAPPEQLDLFSEEEARRRQLDEIYQSLANPPETFLRLTKVMENWEKRQARNETRRRQRKAKRKPPSSAKGQVT